MFAARPLTCDNLLRLWEVRACGGKDKRVRARGARGVAGGVRGRTARKPKGRAAHRRACAHVRARVASPGAYVSCAGEGCRVFGPGRALSQPLTLRSRMYLLNNTTLLVVALLLLRIGSLWVDTHS